MDNKIQELSAVHVVIPEKRKLKRRECLYNNAIKARHGVKPSTYAKRTKREKKLIWERINYAKLYRQHKEYKYRKNQKAFNALNQHRFIEEDKLLCVDNQINSNNL